MMNWLGEVSVQPEDVKTWLGVCRHKSHRGIGKRCKNLKHQNADTFHMPTEKPMIRLIVDMLNGRYDQKEMVRDFGYWMKKCKVSKFENTKFWNGGV
jgi:hypothetical protein